MSAQLALDFGPPPPPTLANFVAGPNAAALAAVRAIATGARAQRFVYLWGPPGTGKSHLLGSLAREAAPGTVVVLDDVDRLDADGLQAAFSAWVRAQGEPGTAIVAAGRWPPRDLPLREDLRTRLGGALVFALDPLSDADKARALAGAAERRGFSIGADVVAMLLAMLPRDMGSLAAAIDALDRFSLERKRAVTLPLLREWLQRPLR